MPKLYYNFIPDMDKNYYTISAEGRELEEAKGVYFVLWEKNNKNQTEKWLRPNCANGYGKWTLEYQPNGERGRLYCLHVYKNDTKYVYEAEFFVEKRAKTYY